MSLKIQWVQHYLRDVTIAKLADVLLHNTLGEWLWKANVKAQDIRYGITGNNFWTDVLKAWCNFNFQSPLNTESVLEQPLWYNSELRRNGKPFVSRQLYDCGNRLMLDIVNHDLTFKAIAQIKNTYPRLDMLEYISLIQIIPAQWRQLLRHDTALVLPLPRFEMLDKFKSIVSPSYQALNNVIFVMDRKKA